eukprot:13221285-Heterocapsa_arctica.AAC.1
MVGEHWSGHARPATDCTTASGPQRTSTIGGGNPAVLARGNREEPYPKPKLVPKGTGILRPRLRPMSITLALKYPTHRLRPLRGLRS